MISLQRPSGNQTDRLGGLGGFPAPPAFHPSAEEALLLSVLTQWYLLINRVLLLKKFGNDCSNRAPRYKQNKVKKYLRGSTFSHVVQIFVKTTAGSKMVHTMKMLLKWQII